MSWILNETEFQSTQCGDYPLIVGVICGSSKQINNLLWDLIELSKLSFISHLYVEILMNGCSQPDLIDLVHNLKKDPQTITFTLNKTGQSNRLQIGQARTILQGKLGQRMGANAKSISWIMDDDMRIPNVAHKYLTWLPQIQALGVDILIGSFVGGSPNPPAHGLRVQIFDVLENLRWMKTLDSSQNLPDQSDSNQVMMNNFSDYYYDLSRRHTKHLTLPFWVTPHLENETVDTARNRLLQNLSKIVSGEPFLRPLTATLPLDPINSMVDSCNRGGNTFVFHEAALLEVPNSIMNTDGKENRRSDMMWALVNRYFHKRVSKQISFPLLHQRTELNTPQFDLDKTTQEIRGAALYAALEMFLKENQDALSLEFILTKLDTLSSYYLEYVHRRLSLYKTNFQAIQEISASLLLEFSQYEEIKVFVKSVKPWIESSNLKLIESRVISDNLNEEISDFLYSLKLPN